MNLLSAKVYLRNGEAGLRNIFGINSPLSFIYPLVSVVPVYDYNIDNDYE